METSTLGSLVFNGDEGSDQLVLDDSADLRATSLVITTSLITGTGIGAGGVGYASVENLDLQAGAGGGNYDIQSSNAGTTLKLYGSTGDDVRTIAPITANLVFDARGGDDQLRIAEPDVRAGKSGQVTLIGGAGNDTLIGSSADDVLYGDRADGEHADDGDDVLIGNLGNDRLDGGGGHDLIFGDQGQVQVSGGGSGNGNAGRQVVIQTTAEGVGGHDTIAAGSGDDLVFGGSGNDTVDVGEGRNIAFGDGGLVRYRDGRIDLVQGGVVATDGNDVMKAGAGDDVLFGGGGADRIDAGQGHNALFADGGWLQWSAGSLTGIDSSTSKSRDANGLTAGAGNDVLFGSSSADTLAAGGGNDRVLPTGGSIGAKDPLLIDWTQRLQPSAIASSEGSRQARWLKSALAGRGLSPWDVSGGPNAGLQISLQVSGSVAPAGVAQRAV